MLDLNSPSNRDLVHFFEKHSEWLGLGRYAGLALAALAINEFENNDMLGADEIAEYTGYSRSNIGLILSQLESLGVITWQSDPSQRGRGRKRHLYRLSKGANSIMRIGLKKVVDRLKDEIKVLQMLMETYGNDMPHIKHMLKDMKEDAEEALTCVTDLS
ncbi:MAG: hypothetical protein ACFFFC_10210 [Candidatus Thorarchaeota archaeon]